MKLHEILDQVEQEQLDEGLKDLITKLKTNWKKTMIAGLLATATAMGPSAVKACDFIGWNDTFKNIQHTQLNKLTPEAKKAIDQSDYIKAAKTITNKPDEINLVAACLALSNDEASISVKFLTQLAKKDIPEAQFQLSLAYSNGKGVAENDNEALKWNEKAAYHKKSPGATSAQGYMALNYMYGLDSKIDNVKAYAWAIISVENYMENDTFKRKDLIRTRETLANFLSDDQQKQAENLVKNITKSLH